MKRLALPLSLLGTLSTAFAATPILDTGDTAFMLVAAALVFLMTPGLAFFYGGLTRGKSVLNTMMMSFIALGVGGVSWVLAGYSLAFGEGGNALIGSLKNVGFAGLAGELSGSIPAYVFAIFQAMFAIITLALISGAVVDRMKFGAFVLFIALWSLLIYSPLAHWVWSADGWLFKEGALDFAGGTVIHISAGVAALVAALMLGPRMASVKRTAVPHSVPFVLLGAGLLWFGWFGFNAGSALGANQTAALAFVTTSVATASAMLVWLAWESVRDQKPTAVGAATSMVVGLVAITPACGFVSPLSALLIGALGATASFWAVQLKHRFQTDDALDVFACHGVAGIVGAILTGVFAQSAYNEAGSGVLDGNWAQLWVQATGVLATIAFVGLGSFLLLKLVGALTGGLRLGAHQEMTGIDISAHQEQGYSDDEGPLGAPVLLGGD
ncbi:ammonium transporter [Deinococcus peraridilitoris]|uniref:Ammonium transporter n=1 Tax=Deinococcus peraridilitoris (strain DSM 19664 / LMG 22246 / CIP 109416 / KR-200) TaxID=937777 RepID=L0A307_DEIPD|nr:ammonium transporter [Deinococcus peraridilitoris]AFZ67829.1 ammonium transporter [Deinococcus peraridilitoris DSM 19664]